MDHKSVAWLMVWWYGDDAGPYAALQRDGKLKLGDVRGFQDWKQVVKAIVEMHTTLPPADDVGAAY